MSASEPPRDEAGAYIASLVSAGTAPEPGQFTLDPSRARELLRAFRLADPATWVAEVLQAAVLSGATRLTAEITRSQVRVELDGRPFDVADLTLADNALLAEAVGAAEERRARLAAGLNGAAALAPERVVVRSGDGRRSAALERRPDEADRVTEADAGLTGTCITVERRSTPPPDAGAGWEPPEADRLTRLGRFAPLALTVNGRSVSAGLSLPYARFTVPLDGEGLAGLAGIEEDGHAPVVAIVQHGAVIAEEPLDPAPLGFVTAVDAPAVQRDLGLGRARRDASLDRVMAAARGALERVVEAAARAVERHRKLAERDTLALARRTVRSAFLRGGLRAHPRVAALPAWPILARVGSDDHVSLNVVQALAGRAAGLPYVTHPLGTFAPADQQLLLSRRGILHLADRVEGAQLAQRLGVTPLCLDDAVAAAPRAGPRHWLGRGLRLLGWPGALLALLILLVVPAGITIYHRDLVGQWHWPTATARVTEASYERTRKSSGKTTRTVYRVKVQYAYVVAGQTYHRQDDRFKDHPDEEAARHHIEDLRKLGFTLRHAPDAPGEILLERTPPEEALQMGVALEVALLVVLGVWFVHRRRALAQDERTAASARLGQLAERLKQSRAARPPRRHKRR